MNARGPIRAVFTDMDGTLLDASHRINEYTQNVLKRLQDEKKIYFIIATGRSYADVFPTLSDIALEANYVITSNGARTHRRLPSKSVDSSGDTALNDSSMGAPTAVSSNTVPNVETGYKCVIEHNLKDSVVRKILKLASKHRLLDKPRDPKAATLSWLPVKRKFNTNVYQNEKWYVDEGIPVAKGAFHKKFCYTEMGDELFTELEPNLNGIHQIFFTGPHSDLAVWRRLLNDTFAGEVSITFSHPSILECVPYEVNKGRALQEVCAKLNIDVADVVAFGDSMNDEKMLSAAGRGYIMKDGSEALKKALPHLEVIDSHKRDGVARQLEKLFFSD